MDEQTTYERLEKARKEAFGSRDAREYFLLCEDLGMEPEAEELYKQGQLEVELTRSREENLSTQVKVVSTKYASFYKEGDRLNVRDFTSDAGSKERLLIKYFPGRFGENGKQPLENLTELQIGSLFKKIMEYSEKRIHQ